MTLIVSGAALRGRDDGLVLRIVEQIATGFLPWVAANQAPNQLVYGPGLNNVSVPSMLGNSALPAGATAVSAGNMLVVNIPSGAARLVRHSGVVQVPLNLRDTSVNALVGEILRGHRPYVYTYKVPCRLTVIGTAQVEIGLCTSNGLLTMAGADPGAVWSHDPAVNGGAWLPRSRQAVAGAITDGPNSAVLPTAWHSLGLRFTEGSMTLEWLLDDIPRHSISGAALPNVMAAATVGFNPSYGINLPAGSTVQFGPALFEIREQ